MTKERFKQLTQEEMTLEQRHLANTILAGPRQSLSGPFSAFLYSPEMGDRAQKLGEQIRFRNSLPDKLKELGILVVARHWTAQFEWYVHHRLALEAGLNPTIAADLAAGKRPGGMQDDEAAIYDFAAELLETSEVSDTTFKAVADRFAEKAVVDLICTLGYYCLVSMTLNVNRVPIPDGARPLEKLR
jgi:4-carboxymuconolactone decarboxylase